MKKRQSICVFGCVFAILLGGSTLARAGSEAAGKNTSQYYQCKDLRGQISLQQQPCSGIGVTQTEIGGDGSPRQSAKTGSDSAGLDASASASAAGQKAAAVFNRLASVDKEGFTEKLKQSKADHPIALMAVFALALLSLWHALALIYLAFSQSVWWGLGYLFVPLVGLVYVIMYWHDTRNAFLVNVIAGILAGVIAVFCL